MDWGYRGLKETASSLGLELEKDLCLAGAEPASCQGLRGEPSGKRGLGLSGHATIVGEAAGQGRVTACGGLLRQPLRQKCRGLTDWRERR